MNQEFTIKLLMTMKRLSIIDFEKIVLISKIDTVCLCCCSFLTTLCPISPRPPVTKMFIRISTCNMLIVYVSDTL